MKDSVTSCQRTVTCAALAGWLMFTVSAEAQTEFRRYGTVGLATGQAARLIVNNLFSPVLAPLNPCHVELDFVNAAGEPFVSRAGQPIARAADLWPGEAVTVTLRAEDALANIRATRTSIRATLAVQAVVDHPPGPCAGLASTLEIFDVLSGWTTVAIPDPGPPDLEESETSSGALQVRFGWIGMARGLVARLNAARIVPSSTDAPPGPCITTFEFRRLDGELWTTAAGEPVQHVAELLPGQTVSLDLSSRNVFAGSSAVRNVVRPVLIKIPSPGPPDTPPGPCADVVATIEIIDVLTGRTRAFVPDPGPPDVFVPDPGPPEVGR